MSKCCSVTGRLVWFSTVFFLLVFPHLVNTKHLCTEKSPDCLTHRPYWRKRQTAFSAATNYCFSFSVGNCQNFSPVCILKRFYFFVLIVFLCVKVLLDVSHWDSGNLCAEIESQRFPMQRAQMQHITARPQRSFWSLSDAWKQERKRSVSAFHSFLSSHTFFFTCTRVAVYSAHAWRRSLHGQPERYRGLCPATIPTTHSQRCTVADHPLTCERAKALGRETRPSHAWE